MHHQIDLLIEVVQFGVVEAPDKGDVSGNASLSRLLFQRGSFFPFATSSQRQCSGR
jgi:hypothetical protein